MLYDFSHAISIIFKEVKKMCPSSLVITLETAVPDPWPQITIDTAAECDDTGGAKITEFNIPLLYDTLTFDLEGLDKVVSTRLVWAGLWPAAPPDLRLGDPGDPGHPPGDPERAGGGRHQGPRGQDRRQSHVPVELENNKIEEMRIHLFAQIGDNVYTRVASERRQSDKKKREKNPIPPSDDSRAAH